MTGYMITYREGFRSTLLARSGCVMSGRRGDRPSSRGGSSM